MNRRNFLMLITGGISAGVIAPIMPASVAASSRPLRMSDLTYRYRVAQGVEAMRASAAARGGIVRTNGALRDYAEQFAATEYNSVFNRTR